jgi:predicted nucleic-acid-binding Zn-ribbon protein
MNMQQLKHPVHLGCKKCGYEWTYSGKNQFFATCPYCRHQINIEKNTIQIGSGLEAQDQLVPSTKGRNSTPQWIVR